MRRLLIITGVSAALLAGFGLLLQPSPRADDEAHVPDPTPASAAATAAPESFDPLRSRLTVGWLPETLTARGSSTTPVLEELYASHATSDVLVSIVPPGAPPPAYFTDATVQPGPPIGAKSSRWYTDRAVHFLRWEWAPGAVAQVEISGLSDPLGTATRIARSVRVGDGTPVALPLTTSRPRDLVTLRTDVVRDRFGDLTAGVTFSSPTDPDAQIEVSAIPERADPPTTTLGGRPAREILIGDERTVTFALDPKTQLRIRCRAADDRSSTVGALRAECLRIAASAHPAGMLSDPRSWTAHPIR
ncbi:hypothetical protein [Cryptosporangium phraense]|uniref:Uncharacterized protein n=1 Tax=Cryptosporangium phraense TaxID=2593070 RepID=A0A545AXG3_9ACTN|nr:hypothetical protein [Cryptosporangium phraense]TQS45998.1 hypothetical protein FL583_05770 [Cryptosporangium phraense]